MPPELKSGAASLAYEHPSRQTEFLETLSDTALEALPWLWEFWALPHQVPPDGDWKTWVILGGRGAGKTRAGSEWVRSRVEGSTPLGTGTARRVALVSETLDQARDVMVFGDSGIIACSPPDRRPRWETSRRRLVWPNGAEAQVFSASDPESLRGPQFDGAWADELAKWPKADEAWNMLQFALRLGEDPRQVVTTTPRNIALLKALLQATSSVVTKASTEANRANLARSFLTEVRAKYGNSQLGRQELDGELLEEVEGAFWTGEMIDAAQSLEAPQVDRIVVAVDPPVTSGAKADACGIVVAGVRRTGAMHEWRSHVLEDATVESATPLEWAEAAVAAYYRHGADKVVAEVNQGGELVQALIAQVDPLVPFRGVNARRSKAARAEPVAVLYEQRRVWHVPGLTALEDQMRRMSRTGYDGTGSPDRLDALVWALTELVLEPGMRRGHPGIRTL